MGALMCELNQAYLKAINLKAKKPKDNNTWTQLKPETNIPIPAPTISS